jgi:phosphoglycerol transferase
MGRSLSSKEDGEARRPAATPSCFSSADRYTSRPRRAAPAASDSGERAMTVFEGVKKLTPYAIAVALCAIALSVVLELWRADLRVPFLNLGDAISAQAFVKTLLDKGEYYQTDQAGAPFGMDLRDFPLPETLTFTELRVLSWLCRTTNPILVMNYFFLLTFFLTTLSALFVLRHFKIATAPALTASVLYAFLPYHFAHGELHLFLSAYYLIPLTVMVVLWLYLGRLNAPWVWKRTDGGQRPRPADWRRWLFAVLLCLLVSSGGVYYAFFGCFFFMAAALACTVRERRFGPLVAGGALVATVSCGVALNMLPFMSFQKQQGVNPMVAHRFAAEADVYGLKMAEMFLPVSGHRLRELRRWKERYTTCPEMPLVNDFGDGMGIVGVVGFAFVVGAVLFRARRPEHTDERENALAPTALGSLIVCGLLLGAIGGFGSLFALYGSPMIRCYYRISIYLSFMAIFGAAWLLDGAARRLGRGGWMGRLGANLLCGLVLVGGVFDQTRAADLPPYKALNAEHASICQFIAAMERTLPHNAMVLQLPFINFPEAAPVNAMGDYDHLRMYVNSHSLRWSHGAVMGRYGSDVLAHVCAAPLDESLEQFAAMGYQGIHIDRHGYADNGQVVEAKLSALIGAAPVVSADGRDVFFDIRPYAQRIQNRYTEIQWGRRREWALTPVMLRWDKGFQVEETDAQKHWRHSSAAHAEATIINPSKEFRPVTLRFLAADLTPTPAHLIVSGPFMEVSLAINQTGTEFSRTFLAPPGETPFHFACDAAPLITPSHPLYFTLIGYDLVNEPPDDQQAASAAP